MKVFFVSGLLLALVSCAAIHTGQNHLIVSGYVQEVNGNLPDATTQIIEEFINPSDNVFTEITVWVQQHGDCETSYRLVDSKTEQASEYMKLGSGGSGAVGIIKPFFVPAGHLVRVEVLHGLDCRVQPGGINVTVTAPQP